MPLNSPNPAGPPSRSFLSRFSNPLSTNARNMFELSIEPDDPFKVYAPGEIIRGHVVLTVFKGFDITHLVVALHGCVKVYKHQLTGEAVARADSPPPGKGTRDFEYYGNGSASLFQDERLLCGLGFLKKTIYRFVFELPFPTKSLPSAISVCGHRKEEKLRLMFTTV